jgi:predicted AAA+ superfamily ATPase
MWLDSYIERILGRDLTELSGRLNDSRVKDLLRLVAANQGGELVKARLARQLAVAPTTVDTYWRALRTLYLVQEIEPWTANLTQRQVGRRKAQVSDPALALRLTGLRPRTLQEMTQAEHLGGLIEAWAVGELIKQRAWSEEDFNLYHFRDRNGSEVDIVIEYADGKVFLIEVKAAQSYNHSQTKGIRRLTAELGDRCLGGAVLGLSEQGYRLGDKLYGLPLSILWQAGAEG